MIWQIIGVLPLVAICGIVNYLEFQEYTCRTASLSITGPSHVPGFTLSILPFVIGLIGMFYLLKWIHGKKLVNCLTGRKKIDFGRVLFAMFVVAFMSGISLLIELSSETGTSAGAEITRNPVDINFLYLIHICNIYSRTSSEPRAVGVRCVYLCDHNLYARNIHGVNYTFGRRS